MSSPDALICQLITDPKRRPRLCFVGPLLGRNSGRVISQGEILADLFEESGYTIRLTSCQANPIVRIIDIVRSLIAWRNEIDLIILSIFSGRGFILADLASMVAARLKIPQIHVLRGGALPAFSETHQQWLMHVFNRSAAIVSPSNFLAHYFRNWGFDVRVIPNVVDISQYPYRSRRNLQPRLLWMRTFHDIYNPEMAVETIEVLRGIYPNVILTMAGQDSGSLTRVKEMVASQGLTEHVRFVGFLDIAAKQVQFATHDIYLHTNRIDNMPVSVVEAAAFGLPIVATKVGGIPYLLTHEETALLVPSEDSNAMAMAIRRLLDNPDLATRLSENARCLAERSSWAAVRPQWEALFKELTRDA